MPCEAVVCLGLFSVTAYSEALMHFLHRMYVYNKAVTENNPINNSFAWNLAFNKLAYYSPLRW